MPDIQKITTPEQAAAVFNEYEVFNASDWQPERRGVRSGTLLVINIYAFAIANYCAGYYESVEAEIETLRAQINAFWDSVYNSWDIEPREYFEAEIAKGIGFEGSAPAMAVHHMWKRDAKVQESRDAAYADCLDAVQMFIDACQSNVTEWTQTHNETFAKLWCGKLDTANQIKDQIEARRTKAPKPETNA